MTGEIHDLTTLRKGIGAGDRLVPGTMSQEEADALGALRRVTDEWRKAEKRVEQFRKSACALAEALDNATIYLGNYVDSPGSEFRLWKQSAHRAQSRLARLVGFSAVREP